MRFVPPDIAGRYLLVLAALAGWVFESIVSIALGLNDPATSSPLLTILQQQPVMAWAAAFVLVALTIAALIIRERQRRLQRSDEVELTFTQRIAAYYVGFVVILFYLVLGAIGSVLLGFTGIPHSSPLLLAIQAHQTAAIIVTLLLVAITVIAFLLHPKRPQETRPDSEKPWMSRTWASIIISTVSCLLFTSLLIVVLIRPPWCPQALCPAPVAITDPNGVHDANLNVFAKAIQSSMYVIPDDQLAHPSTQLPESIGAIRIDQKQFPPYRVVVGVHSIQQGSYGLIIESVTLVVVESDPLPDHVNVWQRGADLNYNTNPFLVRYEGNPNGSQLAATYLPLPGGHVQLLPGEGDQLDIQVTSAVPVSLSFKIAVTYRVANESADHTLILPTLYKTVFSDASHWKQYQYKDGQFLP